MEVKEVMEDGTSLASYSCITSFTSNVLLAQVRIMLTGPVLYYASAG